MTLITGEAVAKHVEYLESGGEHRILHEGVHRSLRWAIVDMLGTLLLIIKPVAPLADDCYGHGITRHAIADYIDPSGMPTYALFEEAIDWLVDMGREPAKDDIHAIADIVVKTWPLWWNRDATKERWTTPIGGIEARLTDAVGRPVMKKEL